MAYNDDNDCEKVQKGKEWNAQLMTVGERRPGSVKKHDEVSWV